MGNLQGNGLLQVGPPGSIVHSRYSIDQVNAEIGESGLPYLCKTLEGLIGRMGPVHPLQILVPEALDTNAEPVNTLFIPERSGRLIDIIRVYLKGHFSAGYNREFLVHHIHQGLEFFPKKHRGRSTTEIHRGDQPDLFTPGEVDLPDQGIHHLRFGLQGRGEVKIAIMAGSFAIGYMKIKSRGVIWTIDHHQLVLYDAWCGAFPLFRDTGSQYCGHWPGRVRTHLSHAGQRYPAICGKLRPEAGIFLAK